MAPRIHPDSIAARLRAALKAANRSASDVARKCGFTRQNMQRFIDGDVGRSKHFPTIARELGVDAGWLITGDPGAAPTWWQAPARSIPDGRRRRRGFGPAEAIDELPGHWRLASMPHGMVMGPVVDQARAILDPHRTPSEGDLVFIDGKNGGRVLRLGPTIADQVVLVAVDGSCAVETRQAPLGAVAVVVGVLFVDS